MAVKISELDTTTAVTGDETIAVVQNGRTKGVAIGDIVPIRRTPAEITAGVTPVNYQYEELDADRYDLDLTGATDQSSALQDTLFAVAEQYAGVIVRLPRGSRVRLDSGMVLDVGRVGLDLNGGILDFSNMTTGDAVTFITSEPDANIRSVRHMAHPLMNGTLFGPGVTVSAVRAIYINDTATIQIPNIKFFRLGLKDFATDVVFGDGGYCCSFISCNFGRTAGTPTTYSVVQLDATNTAERNIFIDCQWFNKALLFDQQTSAGGFIELHGCSLDYSARAFNIQDSGGGILMRGGHIESNIDSDYWGYVSGGTSMLQLQGVKIAMTGNKTAFDMFYSHSDVTNGGVQLIDCILGTGASTFSTRLIGGTGAAKVRNLVQANAGEHPVIAQSLNVLAYGGFEDANYTDEWTLSGATPAVRSNTEARTGTYSLSFPGATPGNQPGANLVTPCRPGEYFQGQFYYMAPALTGTSATFSSQVDYLDAGGNSLDAVVIVSRTTTQAAWTQARFKLPVPAPAGTVNARLSFVLFGIASGDATTYVDDVEAVVI